MKSLIVLFAFMGCFANANELCLSLDSVEKFNNFLMLGFFDAEFDETEQAACLTGENVCEKGRFFGEKPGYYDFHYVYFITYNGRVVFASTSEFLDGDYGNLHGSPTAEADRDAAFSKLVAKTGCAN